MVAHRSFLMLGSAVSSNTPKDFQPSPNKEAEYSPQICFHATTAPPGKAYAAVGIQSALDSEIGLPSSSTSVLRMLVLFAPADVRRSFMILLRESVLQLHNDSFAAFERNGESALAQRDGVIPKHLRAPAMQRRHTLVFVRREALDIVGVGDQARRNTGGFGAQAQQRLEKIDCCGRRLASASWPILFERLGRLGGAPLRNRLHQSLAEARRCETARHGADAFERFDGVGRM